MGVVARGTGTGEVARWGRSQGNWDWRGGGRSQGWIRDWRLLGDVTNGHRSWDWRGRWGTPLTARGAGAGEEGGGGSLPGLARWGTSLGEPGLARLTGRSTPLVAPGLHDWPTAQ